MPFNIQHSTFLVRPELQMSEVIIDQSDFSEERATLEKTWAPARGLLGWLTETGHKQIGMRYIVTAFVFFLIGGIVAALMRLQLMKAENSFLGLVLSDQMFTMHGSSVVFRVAVATVAALG